MAARSIRVGTRGSALSLWQARWVVERLARALPNRTIECVTVTTRGDEIEGPLDQVGETGLFTSALERALRDGRVDVAVHSLKDLPVSEPGSFPIVAVPLRSDPADAILTADGSTLSTLRSGARVGTSSPRRECLVRSLRPDVRVASLRGNVDSRVRQLDDGHYEAVVLAVAGLERLGLANRIAERLDPRAFPPAPGQGAIAIQGGQGDAELAAAVAAMDDRDARATASAERACLAALGGGCSRPIGVHARQVGARLEVVAVVGSRDGRRLVRGEASGQPSNPEAVGSGAAKALLEAGAAELLT